ncbi:hypothetical protein PRIPAC_92003, partial [Pristionchus pacificus]
FQLARMSDQLRENLDYECLRSFSSGAFGKVHHGYLYSTGEAVVIKKGKKKDLKGEYELLKQLSSTGVGRTHVVRVFGYTDNSPHLNHGDFNIIMERAQCSLDILLQRASFRAGLPAVDIIQLVADLGIVLAFLLEKQVAHRDIKPQNILVFSGANDPAKSQFMFKLCDFGAARETIGEESECHTIVGTVPFLNPEILLELREHPQQYRTNQPYRAEKCDLWSLGVTIYNAATARLPWPGTGAHPDDVRALHENRRGAIAALPLAHGPGYKYYDTIRADSYPRWLRHALSSLIRSQFTNASYKTFLAQAAYIAGVGGAKEMPAGRRGTQKRLVLLPSLTPSMHAEVDERVFPGASIQLHGLYGLPLTTRTAILTADGITVYGPGQPIALDSFADTTALVWNDQSTGFGPEKGTVYPPPPTPCSREELLQRDVLLCFNLDRQCEEVIDAHRLAASITKRNADRVIARTHELRQWLHSIERNEKHAASTAAVAALMQSRNQDMLDRLQSCPGETAMRRKEVERCAAEAARLAQCAAAWTGMDERHIANWQDSLRRLSSPSKSSDTRSALEMDQKWAATMLKRVQDRLADLKTDANYRVKKEEGIGHVIRGIIALETTLHECVRKMRETAGVVSAVADQARDSISSYMQNTAGLDEAQIRKNLTNSVSAVSMLRANVEKQAELARKMEELRVRFRAQGVVCATLKSKQAVNGVNGTAANGLPPRPVQQPTVINCNQTLESEDMDTITPARSGFH